MATNKTSATHCKTCGKLISRGDKSKAEKLSAIRKHYKKYHPAKFKKQSKKAIETKKKKGIISECSASGIDSYQKKLLLSDISKIITRSVIKWSKDQNGVIHYRFICGKYQIILTENEYQYLRSLQV